MTEETPYPISDALAEAEPQSLMHILAKDPLQFSRQDRDQVVAALRAQRAKWEAAEAAEGKKPRAAKVLDKKAPSLVTKKSIEDLGL